MDLSAKPAGETTYPPRGSQAKALIVSRVNPWRANQSGTTMRLRTIVEALRRDHHVTVLTRGGEGSLGPPRGVELLSLEPWETRSGLRKASDWWMRPNWPLAAQRVPSHVQQVQAILGEATFDVLWVHRAEFAATLNPELWDVPTIVDADDDETVRIDQLRERRSYRSSSAVRNAVRSRFLSEERRRHARVVARLQALPHVDVVFAAQRSPGGDRRTSVRNALLDPGFQSPADRAGSADCIAFVGMMRYPPNAEAGLELVEQILPAVQSLRPNSRIRLIGDLDEALAARLRRESVEVLGMVPDLGAGLQGVAALMTPIRRGSGTSVKVIEALGRGVPVISTQFGVRGLGLVPGIHYLQAETPTEFAAAWAGLVAGYPELAQELARAGRELFEERFSVDALRGDIEHVLPRAIGGRPDGT